MSFALQFPNARLFIHNLLAFDHVTGAEAIARGAKEFGVISQESLSSPELTKAVQDCDCCETAHCILVDYFRTHNTGDNRESVENAWNTVLKRLSKYRSRIATSQSEQTGSPDCGAICSSLAPVIFDLLLQEVRRNS